MKQSNSGTAPRTWPLDWTLGKRLNQIGLGEGSRLWVLFPLHLTMPCEARLASPLSFQLQLANSHGWHVVKNDAVGWSLPLPDVNHNFILCLDSDAPQRLGSGWWERGLDLRPKTQVLFLAWGLALWPWNLHPRRNNTATFCHKRHS